MASNCRVLSLMRETAPERIREEQKFERSPLSRNCLAIPPIPAKIGKSKIARSDEHNEVSLLVNGFELIASW